MLNTIDLNSDMGEFDSAEAHAIEAELMPLLTSVNIACGGHAGTARSMLRTAHLAARHGVVIGAHPGFPDREHFGRMEYQVAPDAVTQLVREQVERLVTVLAPEGLPLAHVKLHGALYNQAAIDPTLARAVVRGLLALDRSLLLYALAGSRLIAEARAAGISVVEEAFVDRAYSSDGRLVPRSTEGALLPDAAAVRAQLAGLMKGCVRSVQGSPVEIRPGTLCVHCDTPGAVEFARMIRRELDEAGVRVVAPLHQDFGASP